MDPVTTSFERGLHLLLFVSGAATFGIVALGLLERLSEGSRRTIRFGHIALTAVVFAAFFVAERVYHSLH